MNMIMAISALILPANGNTNETTHEFGLAYSVVAIFYAAQSFCFKLEHVSTASVYNILLQYVNNNIIDAVGCCKAQR